MRWTEGVSQIVDRRTEVPTAADMFSAATLIGAKALGKDYLGRAAAVAKADLLIWEERSMFMTPLHDSIRNIVYPAQADDLHSSIVDGEWIMRDRVGLGQDMAG